MALQTPVLYWINLRLRFFRESLFKPVTVHKEPSLGTPKQQGHGNLGGQAIRTPTFRRFARIDSRELIRKRIPIFEALGQICANRGFSPIRIEILVIRVKSSLLSHFWKGDSQKKGFFLAKRESIRANRPTKMVTVMKLLRQPLKTVTAILKITPKR